MSAHSYTEGSEETMGITASGPLKKGIFSFKKGDHIDHFFDKVGPMWFDLWDDKDDRINCDFEIQVIVNRREEKKITPQKVEPIVKKPVTSEEACGICSGTGYRSALDGGDGRKKCLVCNGTGRKRAFKQ